MTDKELMQMALDALEWEWGGEPLGSKTWEAIETLRARLAQPEPEPVAWLADNEAMYFDEVDAIKYSSDSVQPLYTAPPQREWQGLTDEEIRNEAKNHVFDESFFSGAVWARGKIMGKNHG